MKLVVLGATGGTGLEIVRRAIEQGQSVTAFVRSPDRLKPFRDQITVKQGDVLNTAELENAIQGHDAVVSGFGPRVPISKTDANLLERFAIALTRAMPNAGVRRAVVESVAFLFRDSIIRSFPDRGHKWQISNEGGFLPQWRRDGRELFYIALDGTLTAVAVNPEAFEFGRPQKLFVTGLHLHTYSIWMNQYGVANDGQKFLLNRRAEGSPVAITAVISR
jgi:hypothetical protein